MMKTIYILFFLILFMKVTFLYLNAKGVWPALYSFNCISHINPVIIIANLPAKARKTVKTTDVKRPKPCISWGKRVKYNGIWTFGERDNESKGLY